MVEYSKLMQRLNSQRKKIIKNGSQKLVYNGSEKSSIIPSNNSSSLDILFKIFTKFQSNRFDYEHLGKNTSKEFIKETNNSTCKASPTSHRMNQLRIKDMLGYFSLDDDPNTGLFKRLVIFSSEESSDFQKNLSEKKISIRDLHKCLEREIKKEYFNSILTKQNFTCEQFLKMLEEDRSLTIFPPSEQGFICRDKYSVLINLETFMKSQTCARYLHLNQQSFRLKDFRKMFSVT